MPLASIHDTELHYDVHGHGPAVLLIHGLGSSGADWAFQVPALSRRFRLVVPDLRGSGLSGKPDGPYRIGGFADDLWALIDHLELDRCHLVGFSLGGAVALEMALRRPQATGRLVMINALPCYRVDHWRKWLELHLQINLVRGLGLPRAARLIAGRLFPEPHQRAMRRRVEEVVGANARRPYLETLRALASWSAAGRIDDLAVDSLQLCGEFDYTALAEKRRWARRMKADLAVIRGSRHGTPFDAIEATNACLESFLSGTALPDPECLVVDPPQRVPTQAPD